MCALQALVLVLLVQAVESGRERIEPLMEGRNYDPARGEFRMHGASAS